MITKTKTKSWFDSRYNNTGQRARLMHRKPINYRAEGGAGGGGSLPVNNKRLRDQGLSLYTLRNNFFKKNCATKKNKVLQHLHFTAISINWKFSECFLTVYWDVEDAERVPGREYSTIYRRPGYLAAV
jgi:hypothetical protein